MGSNQTRVRRLRSLQKRRNPRSCAGLCALCGGIVEAGEISINIERPRREDGPRRLHEELPAPPVEVFDPARTRRIKQGGTPSRACISTNRPHYMPGI